MHDYPLYITIEYIPMQLSLLVDPVVSVLWFAGHDWHWTPPACSWYVLKGQGAQRGTTSTVTLLFMTAFSVIETWCSPARHSTAKTIWSSSVNRKQVLLLKTILSIRITNQTCLKVHYLILQSHPLSWQQRNKCILYIIPADLFFISELDSPQCILSSWSSCPHGQTIVTVSILMEFSLSLKVDPLYSRMKVSVRKYSSSSSFNVMRS